MKKILILLAFVFLFVIPIKAFAIASGIVVTPIDIPRKDDVYYLPVSQTAQFKIRYCGLPHDTKTTSTVTLTITGGIDGGSTQVEHLDWVAEGDGKCDVADKKYHGTFGMISWSPTEDLKDRRLVLTFTDNLGSNSTSINLKASAAPDDATEDPDPGPDPSGGGSTDTGVSSILNLGNLSDIFAGSGIGTKLTKPEMLFNKVLEILLQIAGVLALIAFVWSGYTYLLSGGDTAKAEKGRKGIIWAVTGIILIIFAYTIVRAVNIFQSPTGEIPEVKY